MKKITVLIALFFAGIFIAQEKEKEFPQDSNKKHEVAINALSILAFEWLDISYEYLINEESSLGLATLIDLGGENKEYRKFSLTPYYRRYFSNKFARGFFIEGFGVLHTYETSENDYLADTPYTHSSRGINEDVTEFAVGISIGGKFVSKKGFVAEIYAGVGRNLGGNNNSLEAVGRFGISIGHRF